MWKILSCTVHVFSILIPLCSICVNTIFPLTKKIFLICISALKKAVELPYGMIHLYIGVLAFLDKDGHCFLNKQIFREQTHTLEKRFCSEKKRNRWKMNHHFENKGKNFFEGTEKTKDQCENEGK